MLFRLTRMLLGPYQATKKVFNAGHLVINFRIDGFPQKIQSTVDNCEVLILLAYCLSAGVSDF